VGCDSDLISFPFCTRYFEVILDISNLYSIPVWNVSEKLVARILLGTVHYAHLFFVILSKSVECE